MKTVRVSILRKRRKLEFFLLIQNVRFLITCNNLLFFFSFFPRNVKTKSVHTNNELDKENLLKKW